MRQAGPDLGEHLLGVETTSMAMWQMHRPGRRPPGNPWRWKGDISGDNQWINTADESLLDLASSAEGAVSQGEQ